MRPITFLVIFVLFSCVNAQQEKSSEETTPPTSKEDSTFVVPPEMIAKNFDFPVGKPDANGYFNAQKFGKNSHLGDDWNGLGGGNSDLGDPIFAIANGYVRFAEEHIPSWGNVIRVIHYLPDSTQVESLYAHCNEIDVKQNQWVSIGDKIGTIGNANGRYKAHLHLELRDQIDLPIGPGYSHTTDGYLDPTAFIEAHRIIE